MAHGSLPSFPQPELHVCAFCLFRPGCCAGHGSAESYKTSIEFPDETLQFIKSHPLMDTSVPSIGDEPWFTKTRVRYGHSAIIQPSLKNLDLTLAGFAATKIFDNQHSLPTLTGKSHQLSLDYLYNQKKLLISVRKKFNSSTHFYIKHIIT